MVDLLHREIHVVITGNGFAVQPKSQIWFVKIVHPMTLLEEICKPHIPYHYILPRLQISQ